MRVLPVEREHLVQIFPWLLTNDVRFPMPRAHVDFCYLMNEYLMNEARGRSDASPEGSELRAALHEVLGGRFRFAGPERDLVFEPSDDGAEQPIPIKAAASLGKSLAGLDLFLGSAGPGDVLIIDEPEMNAHPRAQVALVELFALLVRAGVQIVIATHSPYILDHLSTLIEASRLDDEQRARTADALALKNPQAYVTADDIAVLRFGLDGKVTSVIDRDTGSIDWSTFTEASDRESIALKRILEEAEGGGASRGA